MGMKHLVMLRRVLALFVCLTLILPHLSSCSPQQIEQTQTLLAGISITPQTEDEGGVAYDSGFYLRSATRLSKRDLEKALMIEPDIEYDLSETDDGFFIKPDEPLTPNTVYVFTYTAQDASRTWAFQSKRPFAVLSANPAPDATDVYCRAGIEIKFSHPGVELGDYVEINPPVEYYTQTSGKKATIYPAISFEPYTRYTVTVKKGLKSPLGDILAEDYVLSFTTMGRDYGASRGNPIYLYGNYSETFLPEDVPVIQLGVAINDDYTIPVDTGVAVSVYRFSGSESYMRAIMEREAFISNGGNIDFYRCSEDALTHYVSFNTELFGDEWYSKYVVFPETLPKGWYAVNITAKDKQGNGHVIQKLLQISNVSVYTQSLNGQTLIWLNDAAVGQSISGATVGFLKDGSTTPLMSTTTDAKGIAQFETGDMKEGYLFVKVDSENEYVEQIPLMEKEETDAEYLYYSFGFKDRELYQPTDTVNMWGKIAPRKSGVPLPESLKLRLTHHTYVQGEYTDVTIDEVPVTLQPNGGFTAKISFESLVSGWYNLILVDDKDTKYYSTYINVYEYEKPLYSITASTDKEIYTADEPMLYTVSSKFFSGDPVPGMEFNMSIQDESFELVTDQSGTAVQRINEDGRYYDDHTKWAPFTEYVYFKSSGLEDQQYCLSADAIVFPRDIMLTTKREKDGFSNRINITTNRIDTSGLITQQDVYRNYPENFRGEAVNIPVEVSIYRVDYIKELFDTYYNPVEKKSVPVYNYYTQETLEKKYTIVTTNGKVVVSDLPNPTNSDQYYRIEFAYRDSKGRATAVSDYIDYYQDIFRSSNAVKSYRFANDKPQTGVFPGWYNIYYGDSANYALGETINIKLLENTNPAEVQGTVLYTLNQDSILKADVTDKGTISFTLSKEHMPNINLIGAYFDGKHVYNIQYCSVEFDPSERALNIKASTDKQKYRPKDEVTLELTTTDANGTPVSADVAVSVVDEALFILAPQEVDPLGTLYQYVYYPFPTTFTSYKQYNFSTFYEGGGGGGGDGGGEDSGEDLRDNFLDTAAFITTKTDKNGKATVTFTLPDNLTSWRITTAAITENLHAGSRLVNVTTTLPLFLSPIYNTTYIEGDTVCFGLRAYGDKASGGEEIQYTVTVTGKGNRKETQSKTVSSGTDMASFDFGKLAAGDYKVKFSAQAGNDSDAVEYAFTVKESALEMALTREIAPNEASSIKAQKYPVWLGFYDKQYAEYIKTLEHLAIQYGDRADQRTAVTVAANLLKKYAESDDLVSNLILPETDFSDYQQSKGGVRVYSYNEADVQLTARMAVAAPELYNRATMISYLDETTNIGWYDQVDQCAAIMGLAALKQPVLTDAKAMLKRAYSLSHLEILYLSLALAYLGDTDGAVKAYRTHIAPFITQDEYRAYFDTIKITGDGNSDDTKLTVTGSNLQHTALLMLLAQKTGCADVDALLRYVRENSSYDFSTLLEQTAYINHFMPKYTDTAVVRYNHGLVPTTLELKKGGVRYVPFNKNQLAKANITTINGDIGISATYTGYPDATASEASSQITLTKTITNPDGGPVRLGDSARVMLTVILGENAPAGLYSISEWIPSALRYQRYDDKFSSIWLDAHEGQRLTMSFYYDPDVSKAGSVPPTPKNTFSFTYYARCVTEGDSAVDRTYVMHSASGACASTPKATLTIGENGQVINLSSRQKQ